MIYFAWYQHGEMAMLTGPENPRTGKRSCAGNLSAFTSQKQRAAFTRLSGGKAIPVTRSQARQLKAGLDERAFNELVAVLIGGEQ
ncbi:hypothetical protein [Aeromonas veronii]|uniref:hypothetical protein n=1 Tax=Aeromonas veronii TaxID=654 RepID=UPI001E379D2D|nr:hypothetical protein [Aeromonas veronii]MCD6617039.1 hypothetical protein [Aeromonas veronii]